MLLKLFRANKCSKILCLYRTFIKDKGLEGKVDPTFVKKKWENLKQKYKVS